MKKWNSKKRQLLPLAALLTLALSGCVSNITGSSTSVGLDNLYFGTSSPPGGIWNITLDPATSYFAYTDVGSSVVGNAPLNGTFTTVPSGFLDLTLSQGKTGSGGYAVAFPGEGMLLRTGSSSVNVLQDSPSTLIGAVSGAACPNLTAPQTFNFISQGTTNQGDKIVHVAYGSVQVTQGGADSWSFSNFTMNDLSGNALSPAPIADATCPATPEGFVLVSPVAGAGFTQAQITTGISPSGLLVIDEQQGVAAGSTSASFDSTPTGPVGLMGVLKPSAALNVSDVVGKSYAGFESDPLGPLGTIAVSFGAASGSAITGGGFPSDDITKTPVADTTLDLGTQSAQTPGLFPSVTLTRPDTYAVCAGTASGGANSTCIFHGVAVAGQVNGKYVIYTNINDPTALNSKGATPLAVINLALYQQ